MATPKKRKSLMRRKRSRAHDKISLPNIVKCNNCDKYRLSHHVCISCGLYANNQIISLDKLNKKEAVKK